MTHKKLPPDVMAVFRRYRALIIGCLILMAISRMSALILPISTKYLVDDIIARHNAKLLVPVIAALSIATLLQAISSFTFERVLKKGGQRLAAELRCIVQRHILRLPITYFDEMQSGAIMCRIMNDVLGIRNLIGVGIFEFVGSALTTLLALGALLMTSVPLTITAMAIIIVHSMSVRKIMALLQPIARLRAERIGDVTGRLTEALAGIRVIKTYRAEEREQQVFSDGINGILETDLKDYDVLSWISLVTGIAAGLGTVLLMYMGSEQVFAHQLTLGDLTKFAALLGIVITPLRQLEGLALQLSDARVSIERTQEVLNEKHENQSSQRTIRINGVRGAVRFEDVSFAYGTKTVLQNISFLAEPGTMTALVGPSGAGKSTLLSLVAGFYVPSAGALYVDGKDLSAVDLDSYRAHVGVVFQDNFLFNGTIKENVAFSFPEAGENEIVEACRIAHVDEYAERLEAKYDTVVGERGVKLSGGQKQRIAIARAILAKPRILLFDEATSSLDSESEVLIQDGLKRLMEGRTTFVIAHRLSTVRRADQILFLERGRIMERGTHETLLRLRGRYYEMCNRQIGTLDTVEVNAS